MAVSTLVKLSEDKITRQAYQKRQDEIILHNERNREYKRMEQELEEKNVALADKDAIIADHARLIAELRSQLGEE